LRNEAYFEKNGELAIREN